MTIYVSAQIDAIGTAFEAFLGWNYFVGALVGFAVVLVYIVSGGFVAVVWSDVFQGTLMVDRIGRLAVLRAGDDWGVNARSRALKPQDPTLLSAWGPDGASWKSAFTIISFPGDRSGFMGSPQIFVRFLFAALSQRDPTGSYGGDHLDIAGWEGRWRWDGWSQSVDATWRAPSRVLGPGRPAGVADVGDRSRCPAWVAGIYVAVVLAAIMSTVDSLLVLASSAFVRDYYQKVRHPELADDQLLARQPSGDFRLSRMRIGIAFTVGLVGSRSHRFLVCHFWLVRYFRDILSNDDSFSLLVKVNIARCTGRHVDRVYQCATLQIRSRSIAIVIGESVVTIGELPLAFVTSGALG